MLTKWSSSHGDRFHINVLCFCDGSAFMWGFCFYARGAAPLYPAAFAPFRLSKESPGPAGRLMTTCYARGAAKR